MKRATIASALALIGAVAVAASHGPAVAQTESSQKCAITGTCGNAGTPAGTERSESCSLPGGCADPSKPGGVERAPRARERVLERAPSRASPSAPATRAPPSVGKGSGGGLF